MQFSPQGGNGTVLAPSDVLARLPGLEPGTSGLGVDPIRHREVASNA